MATNVLDAKMTLDTSGYAEKLAQAREGTAKMLETFKTVSLGLTGLGGAFAAFRGAESITEGLKSAIEQGRQFAVQARQSSQSVAIMVQLRRAFEEAGISGDGVATSLFMLNKALGGVNEEGQPTVGAFNRIGLSISELKKLNAVEQFESISKALAKLPDSAARANAAQAIFGKGAKEIMAVLNDPEGFDESIKGSAEYALTMQENAGAFERVGKAVEQVQMKVQEFYSGVASGLAPILEKVLALINKIDFAKFGKDLGMGISVAFEAFKDGKIFDIVKLGLTIAFKDAVNVMYGAIYGIAGALQAVFAHIPQLLSDAFSMLTNGTFWMGIGKLLLGGIQAVQGELLGIFIGLAEALGNKLADLLAKVPGLSSYANDLRGNLNVGATVASDVAQKYRNQGVATAASGASDIKGASGNLVGDYVQTIKDEITSAIGAFKANNAFDTSDDVKRLTDTLKGLAGKVAKEAPVDKPPAAAATATGRMDYKLPDSDRLAKVGLFIGGSPAAPGLSEAKRTAAATEGSLKALNVLSGRMLTGGLTSPQIPRYM